MTPILMVTTVATTLILILCISLCTHSLTSIAKRWDIFKSQKVTILLTISTILLFPTCMFLCLMHVFWHLVPNPSIYYDITWYGMMIFFNCGEISLYLLFFSVIHYTFPYDYSIWFKMACIITACIIPLSRIIWHGLIMWTHISVSKVMGYNDSSLLEGVIHLTNNTVLWILSTFLFAKCLYYVALNQIQLSDEHDEIAIERAKKLMQSAVRHTLLMSVIIIFSILISIIHILIWTNTITSLCSQNYCLLIIWEMYCLTMLFCVYLRFTFASPIYNKLCKCFQDCCIDVIIQGIRNKSNKSNKHHQIPTENVGQSECDVNHEVELVSHGANQQQSESSTTINDISTKL
eukprot:70217_1